MHLIVRPGGGDDVGEACSSRWLAVEALSGRAITHACGQGLLLAFTNVAEADATDACRWLDRAIGRQLRADASTSK
jgi:hypothetical protein